MEYNLQPIKHTMISDALKIELAGRFLELTPYSDNIVRVRYAPTQEFSAKPSLMIVDSPRVPTAFDLSETDEFLIVSTVSASKL